LSFGHFHGAAARTAPAIQSDTALSEFSYVNALAASNAVSESAQQQPASDHDSGQPSNDPCAICTVISLGNAMLFATPPLLLLPQAIEFLYLATGAEFTHLNAASLAFQPRAPPIS
jgi:hypothetical protein